MNTGQRLPKILFIEFTSHCNMHCTFCPSDSMERKKEHINDADLKKFLDQIHEMDTRPPILCNVLGEPLLNKKIYEYLDLFEREGHPVTLITNTILLRDEETRNELLKHKNLTIALSIQTVTKDAFKMRGKSAISLKELMKIPFLLIEEKFKQNSSSQIEIHIASNHALLNDATVFIDSPLNVWGNFSSEKKENKWIAKYLRKLKRLARKIQKRYPTHFDSEKIISYEKYKEHLGTKVTVSQESLPPNFHRLTEEEYWGFMFLPNVLLRFKAFALWNREKRFMREVFPPGKFIYIEERTAPQPCKMTDHLGILSNGDLVACCLDYEGEMKLGNITDTNVRELVQSQRMTQIRENAMIVPMCRRCRGNIFVLDTEKMNGDIQPLDKFGQGWYDYEKEMHGIGGRWSSGLTYSYVYTRIEADRIRLKFLSEHESNVPFQLSIDSYNPESDSFKEEHCIEFHGEKGKITEFDALFGFEIFKFYRIRLTCPTFTPHERNGSGDMRKLGIAVFSIQCLRRGVAPQAAKPFCVSVSV